VEVEVIFLGKKKYVCEQFESDFEEILKKRTGIKTPELSTLKWLAFKTRARLIFDYFRLKILAIFSKKHRMLLDT
jgi:hypothetical protein